MITMTGRELLETELRKMGFHPTKIRMNTDLISAVVHVVSENKVEVNAAVLYYQSAMEAREEAESFEKTARERLRKAETAERAAKSHDQNAMISEREAMAAEQRMRDIETRIEQTETPEARDRIRLARMFEKMTERNTCYDNTAYIKGLAAIMAGKELEGKDAE